MKLFSNIIPL